MNGTQKQQKNYSMAPLDCEMNFEEDLLLNLSYLKNEITCVYILIWPEDMLI